MKHQKKQKFDWNTLELERGTVPPCDHYGCDHEGRYPAPKSLANPQDRYHFCLEHVKAYNQQWDYNEEIKRSHDPHDPLHTDPDMPHNPFRSAFSRQAAGAFRRGDTSFFTKRAHDPHDILEDADLDHSTPPQFASPKYFAPKTPEGRAFKTLELSWPFTEQDLKTAYKNLAKKHHPDLNHQSTESLETFRTIKEAYELLSGLLKAVYGQS